MKSIILIFLPVILLVSGLIFDISAMNGAGDAGPEAAIIVDSDSLFANIDVYNGKRVETCGTIIHVCGVDGKKMRLKTPGDARIKVVPGEGMKAFDAVTYKNKYVKVRGIVKETRIDDKYIEGMEKERALLCHVDHTPCLSKGWRAEAEAAGTVDSISALGTSRLRERVKKTGKGYFSAVTIIADSCEVTGNAEE
ncbi:MAG: hypothetical protein MUF59_05700 [Candidatus Krumholzibacteria bacterium]|nr:hypothetical protein [Candidatus Krumholzibacteria bacterium]